MKVAVVGDPSALAEWRERVRRCGAEVLVWPPAADASTRGEAAGALPDAAVVAGDRALDVLAAARSVGDSTPVLVDAAADTAAIAYGLLSDIDDGRCVRPFWRHRGEPAAAALLERFARGDLGDLRLLRLERSVAPEDGAAADLVSESRVDAALFRDVDLLRLVGGNFTRVTAVRVGNEPSAVRQMTVTLAGDGTPEAVWTIQPGMESCWRLSIAGTKATAELSGAAHGAVVLRMNDEVVSLSGADGASAVLRKFLEDAASPAPAAIDPLQAEWDDYVRAADLLQGAHRSLRRRRTIDVQFESTSERTQFKSQMTAIGCGVLVWTLLGICGGLLLGKVLDPRDSIERRAAAAETILRRQDFTVDGDELTDEARKRIIQKVAAEGDAAIVLIEQTGDEAATAADSDRLSTVQRAIRDTPGMRAPAVMEVRPLSGGWFRRFMLIVWSATFAPLAAFLGLQGLIILTRHGKSPTSA